MLDENVYLTILLMCVDQKFPKSGHICSVFQIKKNSCDPYFIDGKNEEHSNWLRFVNCARNEGEQNLLSFQYHGDIYYRTIKHITPNSELLVWYGEEYAKEMGLSVDYSLDDGKLQCTVTWN